MTPARVLLASFLVFALPCGLAPTRAQSADAQEIEEWWEDLLLEGGDEGNRAASILFDLEIDPERLMKVMSGNNKKARLSILTVLKISGWNHPKRAFKLAEAALGDPDEEIHKLAVRAIGLLEHKHTYEEIGNELQRLRDARADSREGKVALGLVEAIGRLKRPMRATGVLVGALSQRMSPTLEQRIRQVLEDLTAHEFSTPAKWRNWWKELLKRKLEESEWRVEVAKRRAEAVRKTRAIAVDYYARTLAALADKPKLLLKELERGFKEERIPGIPRRAVVELGRLGRVREGASAEEKEVRAQAVKILVERLRQIGGAEYDPLKSELLLALGRTGDATVLEDLTRFLDHDNPRMRISAVKALASLRAAAAIPELLRQIDDDHDADLVLAAIDALGQIGVDLEITKGPPVFRVSDRLTQFCEGLLAANGEAGPAAHKHLAAAAWSLGALERKNPPSAQEIDLLGRLAAHSDTTVRFKSVGALGALPSAGTFALLEKRLQAEPEIHVKKAILNAVGRQALADRKVTERAVAQLVPFLFEVREEVGALRQAARSRLQQIAQIDPELKGLSAIVTAIEKDRDPNTARLATLPFLSLLPTSEAARELKGEAKERYVTLLTKRALARVRSDPDRALIELKEVLDFRGWLTLGEVSKESVPVFFAKAQALLLMKTKDPKQAFDIAEACLKHRPDSETWTLALDAIEAIPAKDTKERGALLDRLTAPIEKAPDLAKERYARLRKELTPAPEPGTEPAPKPETPGAQPKTPEGTAPKGSGT